MSTSPPPPTNGEVLAKLQLKRKKLLEKIATETDILQSTVGASSPTSTLLGRYQQALSAMEEQIFNLEMEDADIPTRWGQQNNITNLNFHNNNNDVPPPPPLLESSQQYQFHSQQQLTQAAAFRHSPALVPATASGGAAKGDDEGDNNTAADDADVLPETAGGGGGGGEQFQPDQMYQFHNYQQPGGADYQQQLQADIQWVLPQDGAGLYLDQPEVVYQQFIPADGDDPRYADNSDSEDDRRSSGGRRGGEDTHPCLRVHGRCTAGDKCQFADFPYTTCLSYAQSGKCRSGDHCPLLHVRYNDPRFQRSSGGLSKREKYTSRMRAFALRKQQEKREKTRTKRGVKGGGGGKFGPISGSFHGSGAIGQPSSSKKNKKKSKRKEGGGLVPHQQRTVGGAPPGPRGKKGMMRLSGEVGKLSRKQRNALTDRQHAAYTAARSRQGSRIASVRDKEAAVGGNSRSRRSKKRKAGHGLDPNNNNSRYATSGRGRGGGGGRGAPPRGGGGGNSTKRQGKQNKRMQEQSLSRGKKQNNKKQRSAGGAASWGGSSGGKKKTNRGGGGEGKKAKKSFGTASKKKGKKRW